jgi:hypothetical protein
LEVIELKDRRGWLCALLLAFGFALAMLFGVRLDRTQNVDFKDAGLWISLPVLTCLVMVLVKVLWGLLARQEAQPDSARERRVNLCTFIFLLLCWFPVFLAVYPGFFVYDAQDEYIQVATRTFSTHHPLVHVLLLGGILCGVHKLTGSYNAGIACYTLLQMTLVSGCFTFLLSYLQKKKVSKTLRMVSVLYLGLFPTVVMFALCSAKDALFSCALLLLAISLIEMCRDGGSFFSSKGWVLLSVVSAVCMMLLRNNGIYAFVFTLPFLIFYQKNHRKKVLLWAVAAILGCLLINGGLKTALHAEGGEHQEILTVPIQQLARTYKYTPEIFSQEDKETLYEILSPEALAMYNAKLSDPVKYRFDNEAFAADKAKYAKLWLKIGLKKPLSYLNAWFMTSYGFWYPNTVIDVYRGNSVFTFTYEDSSYFGYEVEQPGTRESKIPWLDEFYRKLSLEPFQQKIPVVSLLFLPGAMFWLFAFTCGYLFYRRRFSLLVPCVLILAVWLTVTLGPTCLPRYVLILWFALPFTLALLLEQDRF